MDEALKKIEQVLSAGRIPARLEKMLPPKAVEPKAAEPEIGITHYTKAPAEAKAPEVTESKKEEPVRFEGRAEIDPAAKIGVGAREFTLDELGGSEPPNDPLMGQILKPSTFREMTLDDLASDGNGEKP